MLLLANSGINIPGVNANLLKNLLKVLLPQVQPGRVLASGGGQAAPGIFGVVMALLLLLPTLHNMYEVTYIHAADGPHEMMVYVQTTYDVNKVMNQIDALDKAKYGGKHQMRIAVTADATWPFAWYIRDYPNICFNFPTACSSWVGTVPVVIGGGDDPYGLINTYKAQYNYEQYVMRSWQDEGYKLPLCTGKQTSSSGTCADANSGTGVGPLLWLSYGDNPPANAQPNLGLIAQRVWSWWWNRTPFGDTNGGYDMVLFIHK